MLVQVTVEANANDSEIYQLNNSFKKIFVVYIRLPACVFQEERAHGHAPLCVACVQHLVAC